MEIRRSYDRLISTMGFPILIESIKTTSMEDVSTRVHEKIKNI